MNETSDPIFALEEAARRVAVMQGCTMEYTICPDGLKLTATLGFYKASRIISFLELRLSNAPREIFLRAENETQLMLTVRK